MAIFMKTLEGKIYDPFFKTFLIHQGKNENKIKRKR